MAVHDLRRLREPVPGRHRAPADPDRRAARPGVERRGARVSRRASTTTSSGAATSGGSATTSGRSSSTSAGARDLRSARSTTCWSGSAAPARSRPTSRSRCGRCSRSCARSGVTFGVLSKERCTGDPAKRTGNEYMFQELATANIEDLKAAGPKKILTSCPHCVKTIGDDYRQFGYEVEIVHSSVFVEELTRDSDRRRDAGATSTVTFHDPCYLGRYAGKVDEPRALLDALRRRHQRAGAQPRESVLLRRRRRAAVRRQGRGAGHAHQRRALQAAAGRPAPTPS